MTGLNLLPTKRAGIPTLNIRRTSMTNHAQKMYRSLLFLVTFMGMTVRGEGQLLFLTEHTSGAGASALTVLQNGATGAGFQLAASYLGILDAGCSATHFFLTDKLEGNGVGANRFSPWITLHGSGGSPISVLVNISANIERFSSGTPDSITRTLNTSYISVLSALYGSWTLSPSLTMYPTAGIEFRGGTYNSNAIYNSATNSPSARTPLFLAAPMRFALSGGTTLHLQPSIRFYPVLAIEDATVEYDLSAGITFPLGPQ